MIQERNNRFLSAKFSNGFEHFLFQRDLHKPRYVTERLRAKVENQGILSPADRYA